MRPFKDGHILRQILFMHAPKWPQEVVQPRPNPLHCIAVDFADAIAIVVPGICASGVTYALRGASCFGQMVVGVRFVCVDRRSLRRGRFDSRLKGLLLGVVADGQANLP